MFDGAPIKTPMFEGKTLEGFAEFVAAQDPNRKIDHSSYAKCAIGEYLEITDAETDECGWSKEAGKADVWASRTGLEFDEYDPENDRYNSFFCVHFKTFGELDAALKKRMPCNET